MISFVRSVRLLLGKLVKFYWVEKSPPHWFTTEQLGEVFVIARFNVLYDFGEWLYSCIME